MHIDLDHFTPIQSLAGGLLIGAAAGLLVLFCGRIAGISGILGGLLKRQSADKPWRFAFIAGLVSSPLVFQLFSALPAIDIDASWGRLVLAGLLVGLGARLGSGCTSGHGVCGLSRLSPRSLVATLVFMLTAMLTVGMMGHG
ncbi:YeeE/YedE family protein [Pantoea stewartii]|uniref:Putative transmembrane protein n=1 Tax=Pantoea stewartii subsp. stewartii DC283 TaxID=660596 RepID=H3RJG4_PANSE|nr:YeeE/YedE thiosulfate transporter family protein [Pantoea stewartii]ARF48513.1 YeeE/YedE family protein [Pantoea stewartii subsp. stewartii DC283]EHT98421.1 putative transmembrane protein [Pantoea stewartii subsp. stewartii DC283]KAB0552532.1 YeeE/YedE family protein [Pantoea stewartii subsp. stewartii]